jgi:predicted RNase H-like nuclease (RuvC/YqgF family)
MPEMNEDIQQGDLLKQLAQLQSENAYLRTLAAEYKFVANTRETEWRALSIKTVNNIPLQSNLENQLTEIKILQEQVRELHNRIEGGFIRETELTRQSGTTDHYAHQNDDLKSQLHYLQCELTDLKDQLKRLYNQNAVLQNYVSRIAELESLLSNAEEEIDRLKNETKDN